MNSTEMTSAVQNLYFPTERTRERYASAIENIAAISVPTDGTGARRRVTGINRRVLPVITEALEFAEATGNENILKGATYAVKAATPPKRMRDLGVCNAQMYYAALAMTFVVDGLEEIAQGYRGRNEEYTEYRRQARAIQARLRKVAVKAAKVAAGVPLRGN